MLIFFSCIGNTPDQDSAPKEQESIVLAEHSLQDFVHMSLDVRGKRPSPAELASFVSNPDLAAFVDEYLSDPAFPEQVGWVWNETLHTVFWANQFTRFGEWEEQTWRSIGWEPLAALSLLVSENRSYLDWVTNDKQAIDPHTASIYGIPYDGDGWGWIDMEGDRPEAGVLVSRGLWMRYNADTTNRNRARANAFSEIFLCDSFLERPGGFSFERVSTLNDVEHAIQTQPDCIGCHSAIDPLGSFFGGFAEYSTNLDLQRFSAYSAFKAEWNALRVPPSYFGTPGETIADLGRYAAADPRYTQCAVRRMAASFWGHDISSAALHSIHDSFQESGYTLKGLARAVVLSDGYREQPKRLLKPHEMYGMMRAVFGDVVPEEMKWSHKHRVLLGFGNDNTVLAVNNSFTLSHHLVMEWIAEYMTPALQADLSRAPEERRMLLLATEETEESAKEQIRYWWVCFASELVETDSTEVEKLYTLFSAAGGWEDAEVSWPVVLEAIIRHPKVLFR